jgi:hypothetical protein
VKGLRETATKIGVVGLTAVIETGTASRENKRFTALALSTSETLLT